MKNRQFTPLKSDVKASIISLYLGVFGVIGCVMIPGGPFRDFYGLLFNAGVSVALGALVWCVFRLIEPRRHGQKWVIAELAIVPIVWLILMLSLVVWFYHLQNDYLMMFIREDRL